MAALAYILADIVYLGELVEVEEVVEAELLDRLKN